jgi:hypothetical protein
MLPSLAKLSYRTTPVGDGWTWLEKDTQKKIVTRLHQDDITKEVRDVIALCIVDQQFADYCRDDLLFEALLAQHNMGGHAALYGLKSKVYYQVLGGVLWSLTPFRIKRLVAIANGQPTVQSGPFIGCTALALESLPETIKWIEDGAFRDCTSLALESLPGRLVTIGTWAFAECPSLALESLPGTLMTIGYGAFFKCTSLVLTSLPGTLKTINEFVFFGCTSLVRTSLPETLETIRSHAFHGCTSLVLTSLPKTLKTIESHAFHECTSLVIESLPETLVTIGIGAFHGCTSLSSEIRRAILEKNSRAFCTSSSCVAFHAYGIVCCAAYS